MKVIPLFILFIATSIGCMDEQPVLQIHDPCWRIILMNDSLTSITVLSIDHKFQISLMKNQCVPIDIEKATTFSIFQNGKQYILKTQNPNGSLMTKNIYIADIIAFYSKQDNQYSDIDLEEALNSVSPKINTQEIN